MPAPHDRLFGISPIALRIAKDLSSSGRVEWFTKSGKLLRRLDAIGQRKLVILSAVEEGREIPQNSVDALNHFLWSGRGLRYFRRGRPISLSAYNWQEIRKITGFDAQKPTSEVPA